jgi:hypothetical protein
MYMRNNRDKKKPMTQLDMAQLKNDMIVGDTFIGISGDKLFNDEVLEEKVLPVFSTEMQTVIRQSDLDNKNIIVDDISQKKPPVQQEKMNTLMINTESQESLKIDELQRVDECTLEEKLASRQSRHRKMFNPSQNN